MRLIILFFLLPVCLFSQRAKEKNTRYVWADSGLVMRAEGRAGAEKLLTVPYGAEVKLTGKAGEGLSVTLYSGRTNSEGEGEPWEVFDYYQQVAFGQDTGYVHAAFLSRWTTANFNQGSQGYYSWSAKPIDTLFSHLDEPVDEVVFQEESFLYASGITVTKGFHEKSGGGMIVIPNATLQEGFHFARKYFSLDIYSTLEPEWTHFFLVRQTDNQLVFQQDLREVTITNHWGVVIITYDVYC